MKNLVKFYLTAVVIVLTSSSLFGQGTATVAPNQAPKGAFVNGSDGNQQWLQVITYTVGTTWNATGAGPDMTITLPDSMTIANTDGDASLVDEVTIWEIGAATAATVTASASQITIDVTGGTPAAGDVIYIIFPVETKTGASGSNNYSISLDALTVETPLTYTPAVSYEDTITSIVTFDVNYTGNDDATGDEGLQFPAGGLAALVTAGTDLITDGGGGTAGLLGAAGNIWFNATATVLEDANNDNGEVTTKLWTSMTPSLTRVNSTNAHQPITTSVTVAADNDGAEFVGAAGGTPATYLFDATLLAEGTGSSTSPPQPRVTGPLHPVTPCVSSTGRRLTLPTPTAVVVSTLMASWAIPMAQLPTTLPR